MLKENIKKKLCNAPYIEGVAWAVGLALLGWHLGPMFSGKYTFGHDIFNWFYPTFQFFAENLMYGHLPLWNPFSHGGEPFYPNISHLKLLEPILLLVILIGKIFTKNLVILFNMNYFAQILVMNVGLYLFYRQFTTRLAVRISLIPILLFSGLFISPFRSNAMVDPMLWIPYILFFLHRIFFLNDYRWFNWLFTAALVGIHWQSYKFVPIFILLLFFFLGLLFFHRKTFFNVITRKSNRPKLVVAAIIMLGMMAPNIALFSEMKNYVFPVRMIQSPEILRNFGEGMMQTEGNLNLNQAGVELTYKAIEASGTFSSLANFLQMIFPFNPHFVEPPLNQIWPTFVSESNMYLGLLTWIIIIFGLVSPGPSIKKLWLFVLVCMGLFIMGPAGGLHRLLFYIYPPVSFDRHPYAYGQIFCFLILLFYITGLERIFDRWPGPFFISSDSPRFFRAVAMFSGLLVTLIYVMSNLQLPALRFEFLFFIPIVVIGHMLLRDLGSKGLFWSLAISQVLVVVLLSHANPYYVGYLCFYLLLPISIYYLYLRKSKVKNRPPSAAFCALLLLFQIGDLNLFLLNNKQVINTQVEPGAACGIDTDVHRPILPVTRYSAPKECLNKINGGLRYIPVVLRRPYALSPAAYPKKETTDFEQTLKHPRWNSLMFLSHYYDLVHSGFPYQALQEMFAIDKPLFQYKRGSVFVDPREARVFFDRLGPKVDSFFRNFVIVNSVKEAVPPETSAKERNDFSVDVSQHSYNAYSLKIQTNQRGLVYWSDGYDKNWHAYGPEGEIPIYRANFNFKAMPVQAGASQIFLDYKPITFEVSVSLYLVFLVGSLLTGIVTMATSTRRRQNC